MDIEQRAPMTDLKDLARRVSELQGPSREVDDLILQAIGWTIKPHPYSWERGQWIDPSGALTAHRKGDWWFKPTGSLDAAMTLVPERWKLRQMHFNGPCADDRKWHLNLRGGSVGQDVFVGRGATPALALTAAALIARSSQ